MPGGNSTDWQVATVESVVVESPRVKLFRLRLPVPGKFRAGQHYDIRLTAPDGYQAQRSYSVASSPTEPGLIELAVELVRDGEVSSFFHESVDVGERIELRGPIGGHFTWTPDYRQPVLLVAGGVGIAPLMSVLRHRQASGNSSPVVLMFSVRTEADVLFRRELEQMALRDPDFALVVTLTRYGPAPEPHSDWTGGTRRIDRQMIEGAFLAQTRDALAEDSGEEKPRRTFGRAYVCGGTGFVESISSLLIDSGMGYDEVRTERFGP